MISFYSCIYLLSLLLSSKLLFDYIIISLKSLVSNTCSYLIELF